MAVHVTAPFGGHTATSVLQLYTRQSHQDFQQQRPDRRVSNPARRAGTVAGTSRDLASHHAILGRSPSRRWLVALWPGPLTKLDRPLSYRLQPGRSAGLPAALRRLPLPACADE